ncbi:MAG TPA: biotin/lipoate A/B protein ligase family protein [Dehalococcoidia bacterium]|nr:biotin/lipoate A/B protein ligase family protein [Dehalococcoidia bacterium]
MTLSKSKRGWRFIDTGINDSFLNMAIDEAILDAHLQGFCPPTLRVYRWNPPALSLGYFQSLEREIDMKRCSELGIDVVRRLTGGRAVLHHDELTYSVVSSEEYGFPKSIAKSYWLLSEGLIAAYRILGLEVCLTTHAREPSSAACFSSAGLADLTFRGRKLCGSAQFRKGNALLQHGSLPISLDAQLFFSILKFPSNAIRDKAQADFGQKAASISEISGNKIGWQELKEALFKGFQKAPGIKLYDDRLTAGEIDLSQKLAREKYKAFAWNYHGRYEA